MSTDEQLRIAHEQGITGGQAIEALGEIHRLENEVVRLRQERRWLLHDMHRIAALTTETAPHGGIAEYDEWSNGHRRLNDLVRGIATTSIQQNSDGVDPL